MQSSSPKSYFSQFSKSSKVNLFKNVVRKVRQPKIYIYLSPLDVNKKNRLISYPQFARFYHRYFHLFHSIWDQRWDWRYQIPNCSYPAPSVLWLCGKTRLDSFLPKIAHWLHSVLVWNIEYIVTNEIFFYLKILALPSMGDFREKTIQSCFQS